MMSKDREIYHAYVSGFRNGAGRAVSQKDKAARDHEDDDIRRAWLSGHQNGTDALHEANQKAERMSGYSPVLVRKDNPDETLHDASVTPRPEPRPEQTHEEFMADARKRLDRLEHAVAVLGPIGLILRSIEAQSAEHSIRAAAGAALVLVERQGKLDPAKTHAILLAEALRDVLRVDGVFNDDAEPTGPELLLAAKEYVEHELGKEL